MSRAAIVFDVIDEIIDDLIQGVSTATILPRLKTLSKSNFQRLLDTLSTAYHEDEPIISDAEFDLIEEVFVSKYGKNLQVGSKPLKEAAVIRPSGAKPRVVPLPIPMWGLAKFKDDHALGLYKKKFPTCSFVITDKLDGVSVYFEQSRPVGSPEIVKIIYKRGDENEGSDLTYLLPYLQHPTLVLKEGESFSVRAEVVMPLKTFTEKYSKDNKNTRNMTAGLLNSKTLEMDKIADLHIVAYHIYSGDPLPQSQQLAELQTRGFHIPNHCILTLDDINTETLTAETKLRKRKSLYDIDGICIAADLSLPLPTSKEPEHVVAFKIQGDTAITTVNFIEWNVNKLGNYIPRVNIEPVDLDGATISWITANNARWVVEYGLGPNAKIIVTRSGSVIPKILETLEKVEPQFPEEEWIWEEADDDDPVHIRLPVGIESDDQKIRKIVSFFDERGAEFMARTTITKLYEGGLDTLEKLFTTTVEDIICIEGFQKKSAERVIENIEKAITGAPIHEIMAASGCFPGFGKKRLKLIIDNEKTLGGDARIGLPPWTGRCFDNEEIRTKILGIPSIGPKLADAFVKCNPQFESWMNEHWKYIRLTPWTENIRSSSSRSNMFGSDDEPDDADGSDDEPDDADGDSLRGMTMVFSGTRADMPLQRAIEKRGGRIVSGISKKVDILVVKSLEGKETTKVKDAKANDIIVMTLTDFLGTYCLG